MITEFGNAYQRTDGYIQITSGPNKGKLLHRLIYEECFGSIPKGFCIHHKDGDKTNNNPTNLMLLSKSNHHSLHTRKEKHPRWDDGPIGELGGINFLSAEKNKGLTMQEVADECGYSNVSTVFHYLDKRGLKWNQL